MANFKNKMIKINLLILMKIKKKVIIYFKKKACLKYIVTN
jgi:hypothetical protein